MLWADLLWRSGATRALDGAAVAPALAPRPAVPHHGMLQLLREKKMPLFILLALWLSWESLGVGPFSYVRIHDVADSILPRYLLLPQDLLRYGVSYWFPYMGCGVDRLANDMLYPHFVTLLFGVFPGWLAYGLFVFLKNLLGGYFTYRVCREDVRIAEGPSIYAGCAFALFTNDLLCFQLGFSGFPFILWSLERLGESGKRTRWPGVLLLAILYSFCSSLVWTLPFSLISISAWFLLARKKRTRHFLLPLIVFSGVSLLMQVPVIWSLLLNSPSSHRADWGLVQKSFPETIWYFGEGLKILLQDKTSLFLSLVGIFLGGFRSRIFLIFLGFYAAHSLSIALLNSVKAVLISDLGVFRGYQFDRFYELAPFFAALCGACGLEQLMRRYGQWLVCIKNGARIRLSWQVGVILMVLVFSLLGMVSLNLKRAHVYTWLAEGSYGANYRSAGLRALGQNEASHRGELFRVATLNAGMHAAYANAYGLETVDGYINLYPKSYQRFWGKILEPLTEEDNRIHLYFHRWGSRIYLFRPKEAGGEILFRRYYRLNLLSLANTKYIISRLPLIDDDLIAIHTPKKAWTALLSSKKELLALKENTQGRHLIYLYENRTCMPRFYVAGKIRIFQDPRHLLDEMGSSPVGTLRSTAFVEEKDLKKIKTSALGYGEARVTIERYSPDQIELTVQIDGGGVLVASNSYSPFWKCRVDGTSRDLFRVDSTFWGLAVGRNDRKILFSYEPPYRGFPGKMSPA